MDHAVPWHTSYWIKNINICTLHTDTTHTGTTHTGAPYIGGFQESRDLLGGPKNFSVPI